MLFKYHSVRKNLQKTLIWVNSNAGYIQRSLSYVLSYGFINMIDSLSDWQKCCFGQSIKYVFFQNKNHFGMCTNCIILNIFRIESVKIYKIFWYIILSVLSIVLLCIHWPVDTNKRWYFYPIYYGSSNTLRSIVYQSNLFRTENLRQCVFHRETFKGQQHDLKAYHAWDNFSKSDPVFHFTAINVFNIDC